MINIKDYITFSERFSKVFHFEFKEVADLVIWKNGVLLGLDVIKYEEKMKEYWYKDDKSLKDFTAERFGETATNLINEIL